MEDLPPRLLNGSWMISSYGFAVISTKNHRGLLITMKFLKYFSGVRVEWKSWDLKISVLISY